MIFQHNNQRGIHYFISAVCSFYKINLPQEVCDVGYHRNIVSGGTASREICLHIWVFVGSGTFSLPPGVLYRYFRHLNFGFCFHLFAWSIFLIKSGLILWSDSSPYGDWSTNMLDFDHISWGCRFVPKIANSVPSHFRFTNCLRDFIHSQNLVLLCGLQRCGMELWEEDVVAGERGPPKLRAEAL